MPTHKIQKSKVDTLLDTLTVQATADELRPIAHFLGECVARRQSPTLARFHGRVQQLRRLAKPESWHRGFADALAAYLEGYFAEVEPTVQRERLAREVAENALWQEILLAMRDARGLNQVDIGKQIAARAPGVASSKSAISIALEDLRVRELVEHVPGKADRRERIHSLTMRGRELLAEPAVSPIAMKTTFDKANAGSIGDDGEVSPSRVPRTEPIPAESEVGTERGDSPRARRLRSEPSPAGG